MNFCNFKRQSHSFAHQRETLIWTPTRRHWTISLTTSASKESPLFPLIKMTMQSGAGSAEVQCGANLNCRLPPSPSRRSFARSVLATLRGANFMAAAAAMHIIEFMQSYRHMHAHISSSHVSCSLLHVSQIEPKIQIVSKLHTLLSSGRGRSSNNLQSF